jgi:hypothetical protein
MVIRDRHDKKYSGLPLYLRSGEQRGKKAGKYRVKLYLTLQGAGSNPSAGIHAHTNVTFRTVDCAATYHDEIRADIHSKDQISDVYSS